jgi:hypothetical protein
VGIDRFAMASDVRHRHCFSCHRKGEEMTMTSSALLLTIASHPFQIVVAAAALVYAARAIASAAAKRRHSRLTQTLMLRHAA